MKKILLTIVILLSSNIYANELNDIKNSLSYNFTVLEFKDWDTENKYESEQLIDMKKLRTDEKIKEIKSEEISPLFKFWEIAEVSEVQCIKKSRFLNTLLDETSNTILNIKKKINRKRPHLVNNTIEPIIPVPWHASYPSGHATQAHLANLIFSTWFPEKNKEFKNLAMQIAKNREIAGVHYTSDSIAGKKLGEDIFNKLNENKNLKHIFSKGCN